MHWIVMRDHATNGDRDSAILEAGSCVVAILSLVLVLSASLDRM